MMTKRARVLSYGSCALLVALGVVAAILWSSTAGQVVGFALIAFGLVFATALVFYEVGLSEDRDREREEARRRPKPAPEGQPRSRLDRMRGRARRLR